MEDMELRQRWVKLFSQVSASEGSQRAQKLVSIFNHDIGRQCFQSKVPAEWGRDWQDLALATPVQPAVLSLFWQAYYFARTNSEEFENYVGSPSNSLDRLLVTTPYSQDVGFEDSGFLLKDGLDSMLSYMGGIISESKHNLYVMAPYWSGKGVDHLQRRVGTLFLPDLIVKVMTPDGMSTDDLCGCRKFIQWLRSAGATVEHLVPKKMMDGTRPFVHAKLMLSGGGSCYLGSANFSDNGLNRSIEVGVGLRGAAVESLYQWLQSQLELFELKEGL